MLKKLFCTALCSLSFMAYTQETVEGKDKLSVASFFKDTVKAKNGDFKVIWSGPDYLMDRSFFENNDLKSTDGINDAGPKLVKALNEFEDSLCKEKNDCKSRVFEIYLYQNAVKFKISDYMNLIYKDKEL